MSFRGLFWNILGGVWVSIRPQIWRRLSGSRKLPWGFMCFQQSCYFPCCISIGGLWCVSLFLYLSLLLAKWFRHRKTWLQGLRVISRSFHLISSLLFSSLLSFALVSSPLCLWLSCACFSWGLPLCVCIEFWESSRVLLTQNRTSGLIIHTTNTLSCPGDVQ